MVELEVYCLVPALSTSTASIIRAYAISDGTIEGGIVPSQIL
jgi:hypothetical protein